jgi:hypothetical protein
VFPLDKVTTAPPEGALELRVTVPVELFPPLTLVGFRVSEESVTVPTGVTVSGACAVLDPRVAVTTAVVIVVTVCVLTVKDALVLPAATVTLDGTVATDVFPLDRVTTAPPEGAFALRVTVPVVQYPVCEPSRLRRAR